MTNKEMVNKLKKERIAVNCQTEEQANEFIEWCYENGLKWRGHGWCKETYYKIYKSETCYEVGENNEVTYSDEEYYKDINYKIITYTDFLKELQNESVVGKKKNYIPQIAKMLGVEIGEEFDVYVHGTDKSKNSPYHFTETHLVKKNGEISPPMLLGLIRGNHSFKKIPILDEVEKQYLEGVIRPFRDKALGIEKTSSMIKTDDEYLCFRYKESGYNDERMLFPCFEKGRMYKGMKLNKMYTLKELGLFEDE